MKAEEYKEEIYDLVDRMLETCDKKLIKHWDDIVWDRVCEISRELAVEFAFEVLGHNEHPNSNVDESIKTRLRKSFDEWKSKQE